MESMLAETRTPKQVLGPVDFNTAANVGARVDMKGCDRVSFLVLLGAGTATSSHTFTLKQSDAASSGNTYDLPVFNPYYVKKAAETSFTKVEVDFANPIAAYDLHALLANNTAFVIFEVLAEQMRSDCRWVSLNVTQAGGAQLGTVIAMVKNRNGVAYSQVV